MTEKTIDAIRDAAVEDLLSDDETVLLSCLDSMNKISWTSARCDESADEDARREVMYQIARCAADRLMMHTMGSDMNVIRTMLTNGDVSGALRVCERYQSEGSYSREPQTDIEAFLRKQVNLRKEDDHG